MTHTTAPGRSVLAMSFCMVISLSAFTSASANPDIFITATRQDSRADEVLTDMTLIKRDRLDLYVGQSLVDVLAAEAGLQFTRNGGPGALSTAFIRGGNSNQTLLLVDGVRLSNVFFSSPLLDEIPLESIERIEVLRGPASSLYGSDAIGGVVQVFTRRSEFAYGRLTAGSDRHSGFAMGGGGSKGSLSYGLHVQRTAEHTFSATRPGSFSFAADDDPYRQASYNARLGWDINPRWKLELSQIRSVSRLHIDQGDATDVDGNFTRAVDTRTRTRTDRGAMTLRGQVSDQWRTSLLLSDANTKVALEQTPEGFGFPSFDDQNNGRQRQLGWQNDVSTQLGVVTVGVESLRQDIQSATTVYKEQSRDTDSVLLGLNGTTGPHGWQLQLRSDDISTFGRKNTGLATYGYQLSQNLRLRAAQSTAFRAPALIDLYFPFGSNPDLRPEEGRNSEAGIDLQLMGHELRFTAFRNRVDNLITLDENFIPQNSQAKLTGASISDLVRWGAWRLQGRLDFVDPENTITGRQLNRRSKEQGSVLLDYVAQRWTAGGRWFARGSRFNDPNNRVELPGYATVDLHYTRRISDEWKWSVRLDNVFDRTYETTQFFRQPERRWFVTFAWEPK